MVSSYQNKDAIIEQQREAFGFEAALQEEVAAWHQAEASLGDRCDRLEMSLLAMYSHCIPAGGEAITLSERLSNLEATMKASALSERLDNLETTVKGSLDELNAQLETLRHAHAGLARAHDGLEASSDSSYTALQRQQASLSQRHSEFLRELEAAKQAQSNHGSRLSGLDTVVKELGGRTATASSNTAACQRLSALEDHVVVLMEQNDLLQKSIDTLGSNERSSANSSPQDLSTIEERLAAIEREHAFLPSAAEQRLSAVEKEYTSLPSAFAAVDKRLTAIEKEHDVLPQGRLTLGHFEIEAVQSPIPSLVASTTAIAEACSLSVCSEVSREGIENVQAVSMAQTAHSLGSMGRVDVIAAHQLDNDNAEGADSNQPLEDSQQTGCVADDVEPRIIAKQNFAVAINILKIAQKKRQDEQQKTSCRQG
jgi:hypothetical protein